MRYRAYSIIITVVIRVHYYLPKAVAVVAEGYDEEGNISLLLVPPEVVVASKFLFFGGGRLGNDLIQNSQPYKSSKKRERR